MSAEAVAGIISGVNDAINIGYNIYSNERDFDYQKSLQNEIFAREDNAVQRRMKDLQAAGLNPNLAAGSAAGAGAVVGRSNTPNISGNPVGTALDMASHVQQLRAQREQNEILRNQKVESQFSLKDKVVESLYDRASLYKSLGINNMAIVYDNNGLPTLYSPSFKPDKNGVIKVDLEDSPLFKAIDYQNKNNKNSADLLQKDVDWYTIDKVENLIGAGARAAAGFGGAYWNFNRRR